MSYFTVKLMLSNCFTTYMITGKLKPDSIQLSTFKKIRFSFLGNVNKSYFY